MTLATQDIHQNSFSTFRGIKHEHLTQTQTLVETRKLILFQKLTSHMLPWYPGVTKH